MLTLQFVPHNEFKNLSTSRRIKKILDLVKEEKIVLVEGKLPPNEETALIEKTMESVNKSFRGIELCTIDSDKDSGVMSKLKSSFVNMLIGNRSGLTIIGPAAIVKEIKRDPNKIQLLTENSSKKQKKRRR